MTRQKGIAAAVGLVLLVLGAIGVHVRTREHRRIITTVGYFLIATALLLASMTQCEDPVPGSGPVLAGLS